MFKTPTYEQITHFHIFYMNVKTITNNKKIYITIHQTKHSHF